MTARRKPSRKELISKGEVCTRLGISERTLKRWSTAGEFGFYEFRGTIKFDAREIEDYKRRHRVGPPLPPNLSLYPLPRIHDERANDSSVSTSPEISEPITGENGGQS